MAKKASKKATTKKAAKSAGTTKKATTKKAASKSATTKKAGAKTTAKSTTKKAGATATTKKSAGATTKKAAAKTTAKATTKKVAAKAKSTTKKAAAKKTKRKANPALLIPLTPNSDLAAVVGNKPLPRGQVMKKIWEYVKANKLQDPANGQYINTDDKLKTLFKKSRVHMTEFGKMLRAPYLK